MTARLTSVYVSVCLSYGVCGGVVQARMKKGQNLGLLPGGFEEATLYARGAYRVYIQNRTGGQGTFLIVKRMRV